MGEDNELLANGSVQADMNVKEEPKVLENMLAKYLHDFAIEHDTVIGYINEFDTFKEIVEKMKIQGFAFSVRDSGIREKQRGKLKKNSKSGEENSDEGKKEQLQQHLTVFFQLRAMPIKFFGMPFTIEKTTHYQCAYGCKYYKSKAGSNQKNEEGVTDVKPLKKKKVGSKKMGCLAKMTIKHITVYPQYELFLESDWRKKKMLIENLRKDLTDGAKTVERLQRFYLSVSVQSCHNHPPIIVTPKVKGQKRKDHKVLVKSNAAKKIKTEENPKMVISNEERGLWHGELATSSETKLKEEQERRENTTTNVLNLQDENFFHTLVKFPSSQMTVFEQVEVKSNTIEVEMGSYDQNENTQTIEVYEYHPTIQDLQTLFKEKLKRLYTLCNTCGDGSLLLRLAIDLEHIELQLSNDVGFANI